MIRPREVLHQSKKASSSAIPVSEARSPLSCCSSQSYSGMSVGRTAAALFLHQNTVGLRLKKIEEVTGLSLQQPESWLQLKLALMAADVLGGVQPAMGD